ncbi:MAG: SGNH/GDSL hydrolase family protein [Bacteroidota bacterium]
MRLLTIIPALLLIFACQDDDDMLTTRPEVAENLNISYLALGDSYTIGTSVDMRDRWPIQLAKALRQDSITVTQQAIIATNGWTTSELKAGIAAADLTQTFDLVSLLIGVNNQYRGQPLAGYQTEFEELLNTAIQLAGGDTSRVFVVSIPDYAYTPFGGGREEISTELLRFNAAASVIANDYNVPFLNITPISQQGLDDPELVATDNLHPSGKQYKRWVDEVILQAVIDILRG